MQSKGFHPKSDVKDKHIISEIDVFSLKRDSGKLYFCPIGARILCHLLLDTLSFF